MPKSTQPPSTFAGGPLEEPELDPMLEPALDAEGEFPIGEGGPLPGMMNPMPPLGALPGMPGLPMPLAPALPKLTKRKSISFTKAEKDELVHELIEMYDQALSDRVDWMNARNQRYAKLRGWLESKTFPWDDAANSHVPVLMTNSLRIQDSLHNAVMTHRPVMGSKALQPANKNKEESVDQILDYQFFIEQNGEEKIGHLADSYINDGVFVAFIPWIRDERTIVDVRNFPKPPDEIPIPQYCLERVQQMFPEGLILPPKDPLGLPDPFAFRIAIQDENNRKFIASVEFFADEEDRVVMVSKRPVVIFDGPCVIPKSLEDVVIPPRSENLQAPGPSNPNGAPFVVLIDYPMRDEIVRLQKRGFYDMPSAKEMEALDERTGSGGQDGSDPQAQKQQKDALAGQTYGNADIAKDQFTRLTCFVRRDVDEDGLDEDVIFSVLLEAKLLLRARYQNEVFPANPPRRPFGEGHLIPVPGQFYSIGILELLEHLHDLMKTMLDQAIDNGTITNMPFGFYRTASGTRPEAIKMVPGRLYPVSDPTRDVNFPNLGSKDQSFFINMFTLLQQMSERESMVGELQLGRVPFGKASALRAASTTQSILQQGDARPERILRRFFRGLTEIFQQMHELNQSFLPKKKQYRVTGITEEGTEAYRTIDDPQAISGRFAFDFQANILNTNRALHGEIMQTLAGLLINGLTIQLGLVDPEKIYNVFVEIIKAFGEDPNKYLNKPAPGAGEPLIMAEDAITLMLQGEMPRGRPAEGPQIHLQKLLDFEQSDKFGLFSEGGLAIYRVYREQLKMAVLQEQKLMQLQGAAQEFSQGLGGPKQPGPNGSSPVSPNAAQGQPNVQGGELLDETMPSAGGGANGKRP